MKTLEDYICKISKEEAAIFCYLRSIILSCAENIEEKTANNTPAYYYNNFLLCNINISLQGVELVISNSKNLCDPFKLFVKKEYNRVLCDSIAVSCQTNSLKLIVMLKQAILFSELKDISFKHQLKRLNR